MGITNIERVVAQKCGLDGRNTPIEVRGGVIVPHALAKRIDASVNQWLSGYVTGLRRSDPLLIDLVARPNPNYPDFVYLPGRQPVTDQYKKALADSVKLRLGQLNKRKMLPEQLNFIYQAALVMVYDRVEAFRLPYLCLERALTGVFNVLNDQNGVVDLFHSEKEHTRTAIFLHYTELSHSLEHQLPYLHAALGLALNGCWLDISANQGYFSAFQNFRLNDLVKGILYGRSSYYHNDTGKVGEFLREPQKIVYVLDNTGEAILDLMAINVLLLQGHQVSVIARPQPVFNDETASELNSFLADHAEPWEFKWVKDDVRVLSGNRAPGIDLTDLPEDTLKAIKAADLLILKGEGNLLGFPPEIGFRQNILHLFIAQNPLFFEGLGKFMGKPRDPLAKEAVAWFRPAE